ncbi:phage tail family protein [Lacticaseibacillus chiayiensis]|uniref:Phage tail family protein n=1 Tax=Lacticaseibacillus chiayiensis TaxID=2100821 RepID=A0ABY6H772_9LACO|nr:distal tail protein Dit [Lacticaseibacillus chiayiensis]UYN57218.1 phage tail family protein [Lacticaseibacillus chiayiensis]
MANLIFGDHKIGSSSLQFSAARGIFSEVENTTQPVGTSDGEMLVRSHLKPRIIPVTYDFVALSRREFERQLAPLLYSTDVQKLIIDDRPDEFWYAKVDGKIDMDRAYFLGTGTINFLVPDGVAHSVATKTFDNMPYKNLSDNLLHNTGDDWNPVVWSPDSTTTTQDGITTATNTSKSVIQTVVDPNDSSWLASGATVTVSVDVKGQGNIGFGYFTGSGWEDDSPTQQVDSDEYIRLYFTRTINSVHFDAGNPNFAVDAFCPTSTLTFRHVKIEQGATASPWSPNPADAAYYTDTIMVPNAGTYPSEPIITATINGDDGVLTAINDQGSVLQFGSPDETDGFVKQKSERVYHLDFNQTPTGVTLNNGVTAFPYYEHGNDANVQSGPFGYANGIAYPSTERTASNYWNGPSMSGTIPPNSNGSNTANFQFVNRVNVGTNAAEVGRLEFNLTYQGKIVASLALFDDSASNDQWVFSGTVYDGSQAQMIFWDLLPRNYYRDGNYNAVITKMGDQLTFRLDRIDLGDGGIETRAVSGFSSVPIDGWTAWFPGFSDQRGWSINWQDSYFEWINVDYWDDIPNRFKDGDVVQIDVANRRVLVNGAEDRTLQTIGNDWGGFKIQPGNNTIELLTSSWAKQCKAEVSWQEAWL